MSTKQRIENDLKTALLAGEKSTVTLFRGLKSAILYVEVAKGLREEGLPEEEVLAVLVKEAKQRQESADAYDKAGDMERKNTELSEKTIIEQYLPKQMTDDELNVIADAVIGENGSLSQQTMGLIIGQIKSRSSGKADGGRIAILIKKRLEQ